jgi:hypothetical protein
MGNNKLISRLLAMPEYRKAYHEHLKKLMDGPFKRENMAKEIDALNKVLAKSLRDEPRAGGFGPGGFGGFGGGGNTLKSFIEKRGTSVVAQLDGKLEGSKPSGFGPGGFGGGQAQRPGLLPVKSILDAADANRNGRLSEEEVIAAARKLFAEMDRDRKGSLDEKALTAALEKLLPAPQGPGGGFGRPGGGGPGGFRPRSPGTLVAAPVLRQADADRDGKLTETELVDAAKAMFRDADRNKDQRVDERELGDGLGKLTPAPRFGGFGGPAVPPDRPRPAPERGCP